MNNSSVLDSSAILSLYLIEDSNHEQAIKASHNLETDSYSLILPGEVISEVLNFMGKKFLRSDQIKIGNYLLDSEEFIIIETDDIIRSNAFSKLQNTAQSVSYTDCIVMAVADHFNTKTIFGFNHAFVTNGYTLAI